MSDNLQDLNKSVENTNFLDSITNFFYNMYLQVKYTWYFNVLGYSKEKYLTDVADPVYDGLRDKGYLDKINVKVEGVTDMSSTSTNAAMMDAFNSFNPLQNGNYNLSGNTFGPWAPVGNSTNTAELLSGEEGVNASNTENNSSLIADAAKQLGLDNTRDSDGDGVPDIVDIHPYDSNNMSSAELHTLFASEYGWSDKFRMWFGLSPKDTDGDGIPDIYEDKIGTSPLIADTDLDGISDLQEIKESTDPAVMDTDGDGVIDGRDQQPLNKYVSVNSGVVDNDHDGVADIIEKYIGGNINEADTDHDGIDDGLDVIINGDNDKAVQYLPGGYNRVTLNFNSTEWWSEHLHVQNGFLSFATDIALLFFLIVIGLLFSTFTKWWIAMSRAVSHYEHTFNPHDDHGHLIHEVDAPPIHTHTAESDAHNIDNAPDVWYPEDLSVEPVIGPYRSRWQIVENYMQDELEVMWRLGIIEADNLLYDVLHEKGYSGDSLGDMLKAANFNSIDQAWDAHKIRNRIAHEGSAYNLTDREARRVYAIYEEVLKELKAI